MSSIDPAAPPQPSKSFRFGQRDPLSAGASLKLRSSADKLAPVLDGRVFATLRATLPADTLTEIYAAFLSDTRHRLEALSGATTVSGAAHAIRGTAGMLGATAIAELAERLAEPADVSKILDACGHLQLRLQTEGLAL